jgi:hypothetical protein
MHLGIKERGLCALLLVSRNLQRRSTSDDTTELYQWKVELWARNGRSNLAYNATSTGIVGVFYMLQAATWDQWLYFPSERRHDNDFFAQKIRRLQPGLNPWTWVPEASMLTTRPPKLPILWIQRRLPALLEMGILITVWVTWLTNTHDRHRHN